MATLVLIFNIKTEWLLELSALKIVAPICLFIIPECNNSMVFAAFPTIFSVIPSIKTPLLISSLIYKQL